MKLFFTLISLAIISSNSLANNLNKDPLDYKKVSEFLIEVEGFSSLPYDDVGNRAIGHGYNYKSSPIIEGLEVISESESKMILLSLIIKRAEKLDNFLWENKITLNTNEYTSVISFIYNIGYGAFLRSSCAQFLKVNKKKRYIECTKKYVYYKVNGIPKKSKGLENRRFKEFLLFTNLYS